MIALNSSQKAEGELYIDDGESFDFVQGAYIHRGFMFSDGKLTSVNLAPKNAKSQFSSKCVIERIMLLGLSPGPKTAVIEQANQKVEIELGPLRLQAGAHRALASIVTIRKPMVRIADDWTIKIL